MAAITAGLVAQLRERTGLGMMECKKALTETDGDLEAAIELLRKKGTKDRGERVAGEGLVMAHVSDDGKFGALIELNSETDFVARNEDFRSLAREIAAVVAGNDLPTAEDVLAADLGGVTVAAKIDDAIKRIGEKLVLGRTVRYAAGDGVITAYVHNPGGSGSEGGRIGVLVEATTAGLGLEVAMHVSFAKPRFLSDADVPADVVAKERAFVEDQTKNDPKMVGKPDAAIQSAVDGRLRKFLGEIVLLSQPYIREDKKTVGQLAKDQNGTISRYTRFEVGEGTPKQAAE